jgi:hypothetical protein
MAGRAPRSDSLSGPSASSQRKPVEKLPDNPAAAKNGSRQSDVQCHQACSETCYDAQWLGPINGEKHDDQERDH